MSQFIARVSTLAGAQSSKQGVRGATSSEVKGLCAESPFIVGEQYSFADLMTTGLVARVKLCRAFDASEHPRLSAFYSRMKERPGFAKSGFVERSERREIFKMIAPFVFPRILDACLITPLGLTVFGLL